MNSTKKSGQLSNHIYVRTLQIATKSVLFLSSLLRNIYHNVSEVICIDLRLCIVLIPFGF